ncbi:MAG TPA: MerR family transcriptional regulator [Kineosporiaceae bacterium]
MTSRQQTPSTMTIGELSRVSGLSASAIRFYQRRGVLPAREGEGSWQRFDHSTLDRLALIELAKLAGFSLDEVVRILDAFDADPDTVPAEQPVWQGLAEVKIRQIDTTLHRLGRLRDLLQGALDLGYLPADRARAVPGVLGWTAPVEAVDIPTAADDAPQVPGSQARW